MGNVPTRRDDVTVRIHAADDHGESEPQALHTLTNPERFSVGTNTFEAPADALLTAGATYFVVFEYGDADNRDFSLDTTESHAEDAALTDWTIANRARNTYPTPLMIRINGHRNEAPPAMLSVADAEVTEGEGAELNFAITLNYNSAERVTVDYRTVDGTAHAGTGKDYNAETGALTFEPGQTAKTVSVTVLDDTIDEGQETLTLLLFNAIGAGLERAEATGTITNADPLPRAWLVRFGRTVASHVAEGIGERLMQTEQAQPHARVAGLRLPLGDGDLASPTPTQSLRDPGYGTWPGDPGAGWEPGGPGASAPAAIHDAPIGSARGLTSRDLLLGSSFLVRFGGANDEDARRWTFWGQGRATRFDGKDGAVALDGKVTTYMVGADTAWDQWLAGVALAQSRGDGGYEAGPGERTDRGALTSTLTSVHPYLRYTVSDWMTAWGTLGYGRGEVTLDKGDAGTWSADTAMHMAAAGARGVLKPAAYTGGFELALRTDALFTRIASGAVENDAGRLAASEGHAGRLRLIVEGARTLTFGHRTLTPSLELGLRHDTGDAETGTGVELGGGLRFADPTRGLSVDVKARSLIAHQDEAYREWGASAAIRVNPDASGHGLLLTVTPSWGNAVSGAERLWTQRNAHQLANYGALDAGGRLDAEVGYALTGPKGLGIQTPYAALSMGHAGGRTVRIGWRLAMGPKGRLDLECAKRELRNQRTDYGILLRAVGRW